MLPLLVVIAVIAVWWFTRVGELFCISVRNGKLLVVRGRVPVALRQDFAEAVAERQITRGTIRAWKTETGGELHCGGRIDEGLEQRLRNMFMLYPVSRLRQAPAIQRPTLGQLSGIAWIAWLFERR